MLEIDNRPYYEALREHDEWHKRHLLEMQHIDELDSVKTRHHNEMMELLDEILTVKKAYNKLADQYT